MHRTNIYLDEVQLLALKHVAAQQGRSVAAVVREAVNRHLAATLSNEEWRQEWDRIVQRFRESVPSDMTPDEIEAEITAAREEVRELHRAARRG